MNSKHEKMSDVWESGYCKDTVSALSAIGLGDENRRSRISYMREHLPECERCQMANLCKGLEEEVANELVERGHTTALMKFYSGQPSPVPYESEEYASALSKVIKGRGFKMPKVRQILSFILSVQAGKEV